MPQWSAPQPRASQRRPGTGVSKIISLAAALVLLLAGAAFWVSSTPHPPIMKPVRLEAISSSGTNPFTSAIGADKVDLASLAAPGIFPGDTPGMYGIARDVSSCDAGNLKRNLMSSPTVSTAWSAALGIQPADIPAFVDSLNPVVLRSDTAVTSNGFANDTFSPYPAVLQAGTAVFVDSRGQPTVKCTNGNPLTRVHDLALAAYANDQPWVGFQRDQLTYVAPAQAVIVDFVLVDVDTSTSMRRAGNRPWPGEKDRWLREKQRWEAETVKWKQANAGRR